MSALVSHQSEVMENREIMVERHKELEIKYPNEVPKPEEWGGYKIIPDRFEFWNGQSNRLHDRIIFRKLSDSQVIDNKLTKLGEDGWILERLQP